MTVQPQANWYPDPSGRNELRYWDGTQWTQHVVSRGLQGIDSLIGRPQVQAPAQAPILTLNRASKKIQRQLRGAGIDPDAQAGGGSLLTEPVLVVNQKAKFIEVNAEYAVYNQHGQQIGMVREVGQSIMRNSISPLSGSNRTKRLQILDSNGRVLIVMTRPATIARSTVIVRDADGAEIGKIVQKNFGIIGKIRFDLESGGRKLGSINAEGWNVWDFNIQDSTGSEIARITKTWVGLSKQMSTKRDRYVVQIHQSLDEPLRSLVVTTALAIDTALRQQK